jgi:AraC-like DNA-binding protein
LHNKGIYQHQGSASDLSFSIREYHQPHFTSPYHFHECYELILIAKSHGKLYAGTTVLNFNDGDIFVFGPKFAHCFYNDPSFSASGETAHAIVLFIHEDFLGSDFFTKPELARIRELLQESNNGIKLAHPTQKLQTFFKDLPKMKGMPALLQVLHLLHQLSILNKKELQTIDTDTSKTNIATEEYDKLDAVFKYVLENFKDGVSSRKAASLACLNEAAFCRYFKKRTEKTFSQFVNYVRVTHATQLLTKKNWTISSICFECGYSNISYFNREFKNLMGMTPLTYKKSFARLKESDAEPVLQEF